MKILDRYLLKTYLKTFFSVFGILYFIFVLQGVWLFIGELAGKDLDFLTIIKFLFYYSPSMIPMVLPLSVLLSAIMTFGDLSEHYEFAAMKSSGISLPRAMRPLIYFIIALTLLSFWFTNNVSPRSEYKFVNMKQEIIHTKPAMAITAGQFNDIENFNIKVDNKTGDKGQYLDNVTLHVKTNNGLINKTVIKADSGMIETVDIENSLKLHLYDGFYYEDIQNNRGKKSSSPFAKAAFDTYTITIDLASLNTTEQDIQEINNTAKMMNISQLTYTIDSLQNTKQKEKVSFIESNDIVFDSHFTSVQNIKVVYKESKSDSLLLDKKKNTQLSILRSAATLAENISYNAQNNAYMTNEYQKNINRHWLSFNDKFVIAFSCLLMFFIGAPLGAIIRKGGMGLPMVMAVLIFIIYHFINTFGKKVAQENGMNAFLGAWLATLVLLPLAFILTYKASKDRGINSLDNMMYPIIQFFKKYFKKKNNNTQDV